MFDLIWLINLHDVYDGIHIQCACLGQLSHSDRLCFVRIMFKCGEFHLIPDISLFFCGEIGEFYTGHHADLIVINEILQFWN